MNRRTFLAGLACLPGLGFLKPEKSKLKLTVGDYGPDDFGSVTVSNDRLAIVESMRSEYSMMIRLAESAGLRAVAVQHQYLRGSVSVKLSGYCFDPVPVGGEIPRYFAEFMPDGILAFRRIT